MAKLETNISPACTEAMPTTQYIQLQ